MSFMSPEFAPVAPNHAAENMTNFEINKINHRLEGKPLKFKEIADELYDNAIEIARRIDAGVEEKTAITIPFNERAVYAASLLAIACTRSAQNA